MNLIKNQIVEAEITDLNILGMGVAKFDGAVLFVQNGVIGDIAKLKVIKCAKNYYVCRIEEMISASPYRVEPKCSHFRKCGGCSFWHVKYDLEREIKEKYVASCLKKEGLGDIQVSKLIATNCTENYRNKAQFPVGKDENGRVVSGFYSNRSHKLCPIDRCLIQDYDFAEISEFLCGFMSENKIEPYSEESKKGLVRHIYLRSAKSTGEISLCLVLSEKHFPHSEELVRRINARFPNVVSISINVQPKHNNVILGKENVLLYGKEKIDDVLCDRRFSISPMSFYQVNHDGAELLYRTAFQMADLSGYDLIVDLYCGIGSISISSHSSCPILGVEIVPEAVRDAKVNANNNGIENAEFICGDASKAFAEIETQQAKNPLVIVDPPRKGLTSELIREIAATRIDHVLYISCNAETLARDLSIFREVGFDTDSVQPVDMFPRTSHVETVALLSRQIDVHKMKLNSAPFEMIKSGVKTIELRLFDEKRQQLKVGDKIVFTDTTTGETLNTTIVKLHRFDSFEELYKSLPLLKCGYTTENVDNANSSDMEEYYSVEEQKKYGVAGIEFC